MAVVGIDPVVCRGDLVSGIGSAIRAVEGALHGRAQSGRRPRSASPRQEVVAPDQPGTWLSNSIGQKSSFRS